MIFGETLLLLSAKNVKKAVESEFFGKIMNGLNLFYAAYSLDVSRSMTVRVCVFMLRIRRQISLENIQFMNLINYSFILKKYQTLNFL